MHDCTLNAKKLIFVLMFAMPNKDFQGIYVANISSTMYEFDDYNDYYRLGGKQRSCAR